MSLRLNFIIIFIFVIFSFFVQSAPPEKPPKKWPCDQVYNPKLNLSSIWQGPEIDSALKDWWKDDDVIEYVNLLAAPVLKEERGIELIEEFAGECFMPLTYGGGIKTLEQASRIFRLGVEKICLNSLCFHMKLLRN